MSDPDLYPWMALRRVDGGGMARAAGAYFDFGRPTPGHLTGVFDQLIWAGLVAVAAGDALWELRRMSLTDTGKARYAVLSEHLDPEFPVAACEFGATPKTPVGRRSESPPRLPATDRAPPHERNSD
ncbi:MAG: hypothetical protein ACRDTF_25240 [Pseudonocardiaceae bacterium]